MIKPVRRIYPVYFLIDLLLIEGVFYGSYLIRYNTLSQIFSEPFLPHFRQFSFIFILWTVFIVTFLKRRNLYTTDRSLSIPKEASRVIISVIYTAVIIGAVIFFAQYKFFSRKVFVESIYLLGIVLSLWRVIKRLIVRSLVARGFHNINILVVGATNAGRAFLAEIKKAPYLGFKVVGFLDDAQSGEVDGVPVIGAIADFPYVIKKYFAEELVITIPSEKKMVSDLIKEAQKHRMGIRVVPENFEVPLPILSITYLGVVPLLTYKERRYHPAELALKRLFDFGAALISCLLLLPFMGVIAALIKFDSKGPVFYIQKRLGLKGRPFYFCKFRSMIIDAEKLKQELLVNNEVKDGVLFKIKKDPRITRIGRWLRKYSLDELPQLFNVLKGEMSLVGPRPPLSEEVDLYKNDQMERLSIRPGITGLSQIRGRSHLTFKKWVRWDLWYINNWSFGLDLKILWWTIPVVLRGKGAY